MARMRIPMDSSILIRDQFKSFLLSKKAYGTADKTLATYEQHFSAISKHLDVNKPIDFLCKKDLQKMIADMRDTNLSSNTIRSYTATLKTFFHLVQRGRNCRSWYPPLQSRRDNQGNVHWPWVGNTLEKAKHTHLQVFRVSQLGDH